MHRPSRGKDAPTLINGGLLPIRTAHCLFVDLGGDTRTWRVRGVHNTMSAKCGAYMSG